MHVFDAHLNVFNAKVHLQILQMKIPLGVAFHFAGLDVNFRFDALYKDIAKKKKKEKKTTVITDSYKNAMLNFLIEKCLRIQLTVFAPVFTATGGLNHDQDAGTSVMSGRGDFRNREGQLELQRIQIGSIKINLIIYRAFCSPQKRDD